MIALFLSKLYMTHNLANSCCLSLPMGHWHGGGPGSGQQTGRAACSMDPHCFQLQRWLHHVTITYFTATQSIPGNCNYHASNAPATSHGRQVATCLFLQLAYDHYSRHINYVMHGHTVSRKDDSNGQLRVHALQSVCSHPANIARKLS